MPTTKKPETVVLLDSREQQPIQFALGVALGYEPERVALPEADFVLADPDGCLLGIERKTVGDFLSSLGDGRLVAQVTRMKTSYPRQGLIVEGPYTVTGDGYMSAGIGTRWAHAAFQMTLASVQINFPDLIVFWSNNLACTVDIIRALAARGKTKGCIFKSNTFAPDTEEQRRKIQLSTPRQTSRQVPGKVPGKASGQTPRPKRGRNDSHPRNGSDPGSHGPGIPAPHAGSLDGILLA